MKIRRDIKSLPSRSATDTWNKIIDLVTGDKSQDKSHLTKVSGIVASVITDEHPARAPFVFTGVGPRVVIYCKYAADAVSEDENADTLPQNPTAGDWHLRIPCDQDNLSWVRKALADQSSRVTAYDVDAPDEDDKATKSTSSAATNALEIDWAAGGQ